MKIKSQVFSDKKSNLRADEEATVTHLPAFRRMIMTQRYSSPCGELLLGSYGDRLCLCDWLVNPRHEQVLQRLQRSLKTTFCEVQSSVVEMAKCQLDEYFAGEREYFAIPLLLVGTDFQKQVWQGLTDIPYGSTCSYIEQATAMGRPQAVRAVANANALNALPLFIPCHRVIGSNQKLTGYAGGLAAKGFLLELEQRRKVVG